MFIPKVENQSCLCTLAEPLTTSAVKVFACVPPPAFRLKEVLEVEAVGWDEISSDTSTDGAVTWRLCLE